MQAAAPLGLGASVRLGGGRDHGPRVGVGRGVRGGGGGVGASRDLAICPGRRARADPPQLAPGRAGGRGAVSTGAYRQDRAHVEGEGRSGGVVEGR